MKANDEHRIVVKCRLLAVQLLVALVLTMVLKLNVIKLFPEFIIIFVMLFESQWKQMMDTKFFIKCRLLAVQLLVAKLNWIFFAIEWFVCLFDWLDGCHYGSKNECNRTNMNCLFIFINNFFFFSGESGSGKTESTNFLLHHLTALSQKGSQGCGVEQTILSAGPVLEVRSNLNKKREKKRTLIIIIRLT